MTQQADDEVVLITGAAGALGRAVVAAFLQRRARLALVGRDLASLQAAFPGLAGDARHGLFAADVTDAAAMQAAGAQVLAQFGRIDVLAHIAGGFSMGEDAHALSRRSWDQMMNLNAWSFVAVTAAVVPAMKAAGRGRIVVVSARAAAAGAAQMGAYIASKSALQRLVETLSAEVREHGINVNSVAPGIIDTPANRAAMPDADPARWVSVEQLAETIGFLASDTAAAIHGQHLVVAARS